MGRAKRPGLVRPLLDLGAVAAIGSALGRVHAPDERARARIAKARKPLLDDWLPILTDLGSLYGLAGAAGALWLGGRRRLARDVLGAGLAAWAAAQASKRLYNRTRPYHAGEVEMLVREPQGTSYPSGHPAVAAALAGVLAPEIPEPLRGALERMPRLVAFSRVYVGVHYPSDVLGGLLLGRAIGDLWRRFGPARDLRP